MFIGTLAVKYAIFSNRDSKTPKYIVGLSAMDYIEFITTDIFSGLIRAEGVDLDCEDELFFMCYHTECCYDPPIAIVRAGNEDEAIDKLVEECIWAREDDDDENDSLQFTDKSGFTYNPDNLVVIKIKCLSIIPK